MNLHDILTHARLLVWHGFVQDTPAIDADFNEVPILHPSARKYDAFGALYRVYRGWPPQEAVEAVRTAAGTDLALCDWNDESDKKTVLAAFDKAIEAAGVQVREAG